MDSFDIHGEELLNHRDKLAEAARSSGAVAVISAGWDPGTDSMVRALMELMAPKGLTFTNFGPDESGPFCGCKSHSRREGCPVHDYPHWLRCASPHGVCGVGGGCGAGRDCCSDQGDPYFSRDETHVYPVGSVEALKDVGHGVIIERKAHRARRPISCSVGNADQ